MSNPRFGTRYAQDLGSLSFQIRKLPMTTRPQSRFGHVILIWYPLPHHARRGGQGFSNNPHRFHRAKSQGSPPRPDFWCWPPGGRAKAGSAPAAELEPETLLHPGTSGLPGLCSYFPDSQKWSRNTCLSDTAANFWYMFLYKCPLKHEISGNVIN